MKVSLIAVRCLPFPCPILQPLLPSREQEEATGLPRPLLRWREAQPLLEHDHRFQTLGEPHRCA
jgi:hypothetical protein